MKAPYKPVNYSTVARYLIVNGAAATIDFLQRVFGAIRLRRFPDESGKLMHAEVRIDDEHTIPLFDRLKNGEFILLFSSVTQDEPENAPEKVKELVKSLKAVSTEFLDATDEAVDLATE